MKQMVMRLSFILVVSLLLFSSLSQSVSQKDNDGYIFTFYFCQPEVTCIEKYNQTYNRITLKDTELYGKTGEPKLPVKPLRILLPPNAMVHSINISINHYQFLDHHISNIELGDPTFPLNQIPLNIQPPQPSYNQQSIFPQDLYHLVGTQQYRGFTILHLNLQPIQYHPNNKTISYITQMTIQLDISQSSTAVLFRGLPQDYDHIMRNVDIIDENVLTTYKTYQNRPINQQETVDYVLITKEEFKNYNGPNSFQDLIDARNVQGITARIETVEEIYQEYPGRDQPEKIRNFIKDAYLNWGTSWILLGGDVEYVPVRALDDIDGADNGMVSDIYYQCLDGDFNFDNDSWWGEKNDGVNGKLIDLYAEVYIGRSNTKFCEKNTCI